MLNSEKLKTYFEENPYDLHVLRHDAISHPTKVKKHMKNVPEYLSKLVLFLIVCSPPTVSFSTFLKICSSLLICGLFNLHMYCFFPVPPTLKGMYSGVKSAPKRPMSAPSHSVKEKRTKHGRHAMKTGTLNPKYKKQHEDPLKSFKYVKK